MVSAYDRDLKKNTTYETPCNLEEKSTFFVINNIKHKHTQNLKKTCIHMKMCTSHVKS